MKTVISKFVLLIIDDDVSFCEQVKKQLSNEKIEILIAHNGGLGISLCSKHHVDIVLLDQSLPDVEGHTLCPEILKYNEQAKIIFITVTPSFDGAVKALRAGAHDYLSKPIEIEAVSMAVSMASKTLALEKVAHVESYRKRKEREEVLLVNVNGCLAGVMKLVDRAAVSEAPVLITGETGSGKGMVAKSIHYHRSASREGAFIHINCAAIPESLIEAELFGHQKGAFTGAVGSRRGVFEMAEGGTLFLDEIGEMPIHLQSKLLGVLEDHKIRRLGGEVFQPVDVRVVAATSQPLENMLDKSFRADLFYRLSVIRIHLPPLRERRQDIPDLCRTLLGKLLISGKDPKLPESEIRALMEYDWPGNVRELRNILERSVIHQQGTELLPSKFLSNPQNGSQVTQETGSSLTIQSLTEIERNHVMMALKQLDGNYTQVAKVLGVALSTLKRKLREYGLR